MDSRPTPTDLKMAELIRDNAESFLNAGISMLFSDGVDTARAKVAVVAFQTAVELFAKYRLVKDHGLTSIIVGKISGGDLEAAALAGSFRTLGYGKCIEKIQTEQWIRAPHLELIAEMQSLRNRLVHFSAEVDVEAVRRNAGWLLIQVLAMFALGRERDEGEMLNHGQFLDRANLQTLLAFAPYRAEAVDAALDDPDARKVFRCWECGEDSLTLRNSDAYFCYCCGLAAADGAIAAYAACDLCQTPEAVCYDTLNDNEGYFRGKCLHCDTLVWVKACVDCGGTRTVLERKIDAACEDCAA